MTPANHDRRCRICRGTGWQPGPGIPGHSLGKAFEYTTIQPCTNEWWWQDNPDVDEYGYDTTTHITLDQYLDRVVARGDYAELDRWHHWLEGVNE
jgi:hypothetical protein